MDRQEEAFLTVYEPRMQSGFLNFLRKNVHEVWIYRFALINFVNTNLRNRYRRSTLGFLWSLLNPLFSMLVMAVVFSLIYRADFRDFGVYIFSGMLPWQLISVSVVGGCNSLIYAEGYLKKVYVPKVLFPLSSAATEAVNFLLSLISLFIIVLFLRAKVGWSLLLLPLALLVTFTFVFGCVLLVGIATVYFRDLNHIVTILFQAFFYMTPIVYKLEIIPEQYRSLFVFSPFYHFINLFHQIIYEIRIPSWSEWGICLAIGLTVMFIGLYYLSQKEQDIIYRL
ncbi:MAG: ABC transporter permease [Anaerolineaceae bacterium]|jgi:ABC-type polysaccharide/polyol phosphate export permease|nr:ABC transporter permease [Anaerolineaceae bacterium]